MKVELISENFNARTGNLSVSRVKCDVELSSNH
jgi:hypothetical protein